MSQSLVPLDTRTILAEVARTGRLFTVEENPRLCGWGAEIVSIVAEEAFGALTGPVVRITTPHIPLPAADRLEDHVLPSVDRIVETVSKALEESREQQSGRTDRHRRPHPAADRRGMDRRAAAAAPCR